MPFIKQQYNQLDKIMSSFEKLSMDKAILREKRP